MEGLQFHRQCRTTHSEAYQIHRGEQSLARLDLHFSHMNVYATLVLEIDMEEDAITDLLHEINERPGEILNYGTVFSFTHFLF